MTKIGQRRQTKKVDESLSTEEWIKRAREVWATGIRGNRQTKKTIKRKTIKLLPLDLLFSKYIRAKANNTCEYCGKQSNQLHCHHGVVGRRYRNTRYEEDNCACLCVGCHWFLGDFPQINTTFFLKRIGSDRMEQLQIIARSPTKPDLELIKKELTEKLKLLEEK